MIIVRIVGAIGVLMSGALFVLGFVGMASGNGDAVFNMAYFYLLSMGAFGLMMVTGEPLYSIKEMRGNLKIFFSRRFWRLFFGFE